MNQHFLKGSESKDSVDTSKWDHHEHHYRMEYVLNQSIDSFLKLCFILLFLLIN